MYYFKHLQLHFIQSDLPITITIEATSAVTSPS